MTREALKLITHDLIDDGLLTATDVHRYVAEASDLGFPVGDYPRQLETTMGNGLPFLLWSRTESYSIYRQANGVITLRVFNT